MEKYFDLLKGCPLFQGIDEDGLLTLMKCLRATEKHYEKNSFIFTAGDAVTTIGIIVRGSVYIVQEDFWGNRTILANMEIGNLFGEAFSCAETERLPVSVLAAQRSIILLIDYRRIVENCTSACTFHSRLIKNMLKILAGKNMMLTQKIQVITQRTTREKLLSYLSAQARQAGGSSFIIPFNRQELAEYLSVDRSAMSNELSKMRKDGILEFDRSRFRLLGGLKGEN